jgi:PleD family two-component response regulator
MGMKFVRKVRANDKTSSISVVFLTRADKALYQAKSSGRDRIVGHL